MPVKSPEVNSPAVPAHFVGRRKKSALLAGPCLRWLPLLAALLLATILVACGGDAAPEQDTTAAPTATEATERESVPPPGSAARDREILVALYNALDGPNWENSENWLSDAPLGEWSGVRTDDNGRVIILILGGGNSGQALRGEIPPELGNLANLIDLWLGYSNLSGEIPPELGNLTKLTDLALIENRLSGQISLSLRTG